MQAIIIRALCFLGMVLLGFAMKKAGLLSKEDGYALSRVIMNITLPCAIISSFSSIDLSGSMLIFILFGLLANAILLLVAYFISRNKSREDIIYYILSMPAYNIGNFTLPFTSAMMGPVGAVTTCLFDTGNAVQCVGIDYAVAKNMVDGEKKNFLQMLKPLFRGPTFMVYLIFITLSLIKFPVPSVIFDFTSLIAAANGPISMIMIGLLLEMSFRKSDMKKVAIVLAVRYAVSIAFTLFFWFVLDMPYEVKKAACVVVWAPVSTAAPAFTLQLNGNTSLAGMVNSISLILSLIIIPTLVILL